MCTVSWLRTPQGYQLLCNRDELFARQPAQAPRQSSVNGVRFIAPVDGDFGGTWIAVNEFGLSLCVLNGYRKTGPSSQPGFVSRRLLLPELIDCQVVPEGK